MGKSIIGDFFDDIGNGIGKLCDGDILDGVGNILGGTLKGAFRTIGFAGKTIGEVTEAIFADGQVLPDEIADEDKPTWILLSGVAMLAKMAKADGHVSESETQFLSSWLDMMHIEEEDKHLYKEVANEQVQDDVRSIYDFAQLFLIATGNATDAATCMYLDLWRMAFADGVVSDDEAEILCEIPRFLGLDARIFQEVREHPEMLNEGGREGSTFASQQGKSLEDSYAVLGCSSDASNAEVKKCYKTQMAQYHPDAISGKDLAPAFIEFANQKAAKINEAYEAIKKERGMK